MSDKHTPGPWEVIRHHHVNDELWLSVNQHADAQGMKEWIAEIKYRTADDDRQWADANRIVACVNACEGFSDPSVVPELIKVLKQAALAIRSLDIDALGEAGTNDVSWPLRDELLHHIDAALAKAEGR